MIGFLVGLFGDSGDRARVVDMNLGDARDTAIRQFCDRDSRQRHTWRRTG
jgi:hypothetical protein